jgi:hypothetical protein
VLLVRHRPADGPHGVDGGRFRSPGAQGARDREEQRKSRAQAARVYREDSLISRRGEAPPLDVGAGSAYPQRKMQRRALW